MPHSKSLMYVYDMPAISDRDRAYALAEQLRNTLSAPSRFQNETHRKTMKMLASDHITTNQWKACLCLLRW